MRSQHVYTEPANLQSKYTKSYQRETNRSNQVSPTPSNQGDQIKKIGNYEMQGNPRIYRNYVQQKIKYI